MSMRVSVTAVVVASLPSVLSRSLKLIMFYGLTCYSMGAFEESILGQIGFFIIQNGNQVFSSGSASDKHGTNASMCKHYKTKKFNTFHEKQDLRHTST
jgi:hypothetical protein